MWYKSKDCIAFWRYSLLLGYKLYSFKYTRQLKTSHSCLKHRKEKTPPFFSSTFFLSSRKHCPSDDQNQQSRHKINNVITYKCKTLFWIVHINPFRPVQ